MPKTAIDEDRYSFLGKHEVDRDWDGTRRQYGTEVDDADLWKFVAGMIARSYSIDGSPYPELTRYPSVQYLTVFRHLIDN